MNLSKSRSSSEIRKDFLDFFRSKEHVIVPSSSLLPDSPNLLFTNAGMNQFVPIFLGQQKCPFPVPRAADTQKCIRAGGKHNDLDDVGLDTYHHTFFEMLGNWSFGDYFKREAIEWAWELVTEVWGIPKNRLYATVYSPDPEKGDPSEFDQEAYDYWAAKFSASGLNPKIHIVYGNKKDNFWMMGETGPCGPCSELHVDLTPQGDTQGALVNKGVPSCIEIWNLVFMQYNANPDGSMSLLPAKNVDTGMGFERVTSILQCTKGFTDFTGIISNYETDIFRPLFDALEKLSGRRYQSTLPRNPGKGMTRTEMEDVAFRVIADHIRTLSFAIADGILPGNTDRNYVLRRILRRAVRYGRSLGFHEPFFYRLVEVLAQTMGDIFPEVRTRQAVIENTIRTEEEAFNKTLDRGIEMFNGYVKELQASDQNGTPSLTGYPEKSRISGEFAFKLYDTYGFPLDLTELMARESGLSVDSAQFEKLMKEQRERARAAQKKEVITISQNEGDSPTLFLGYESLETTATIQEVVQIKNKTAVILDRTVCYAEMGGQVGDTGILHINGVPWAVIDTVKSGESVLHCITPPETHRGLPEKGMEVQVTVDRERRQSIQRHHTVTHLLHWALHQVVGPEVAQKGSFVGPDKLTFDFNSAPLQPAQIQDVERLVNERILDNQNVVWTEIPYQEIKGHPEIRQFFGEKYGEQVRVVQVGGQRGSFNGYSMELCGGTHARATGEIGLFRILSEGAIAAGIRRIEAVAGMAAYQRNRLDIEVLTSVASQINTAPSDLQAKVEALLEKQKTLEKELKGERQRQAAETAKTLASQASCAGDMPLILRNLGEGDGEFLQNIIDALRGQFRGVAVLGSVSNGNVQLAAFVSPDLTKRIQAGKIIQTIAPLVGGKGGGRPDFARGGGKDPSKLEGALQEALKLLK